MKNFYFGYCTRSGKYGFSRLRGRSFFIGEGGWWKLGGYPKKYVFKGGAPKKIQSKTRGEGSLSFQEIMLAVFFLFVYVNDDR